MFFSLLYTCIILPIEIIIGYVYCFIRVYFSRLGIIGAIAGLSLAVSFMTLPIYAIADRQKVEERGIRKKLAYRAGKIKKAFRGDERFMILSEYYRLNHYHPAYALREVVSMLIQLPFFIAAYHFLSGCQELATSLGPIKSLQEPDSLLVLGNIRVNVLPLLMTSINIVSGIIYTRQAPLHEKIQVHALAVVFLLLLYTSPSGLVIYWMLNNLFSLVKNFVREYCRRPWIIVETIICTACILVIIYAEFIKPRYQYTRTSVRILLPPLCATVMLFLPWVKSRSRNSSLYALILGNGNGTDWVFALSCLSSSLFLGLFLPSSMISSSPLEFAFIGKTNSPLGHLWAPLFFSLGLCLLWPSAIYTMTVKNYRPLLAAVSLTVSVAILLNTLVFKHNFGNVFVTGEVENWQSLDQNGFVISLFPLVIYALVFLVSIVLFRKNRQAWLQKFLVAICFSLCLYTVLKIRSISSVYTAYIRTKGSSLETTSDIDTPLETEFHLSRNGKNVFVIFLDRSVGVFVPYIMEEFPELIEQYRGFTLYPNTVSFSTSTFEGAPPLYGGYEYTPQEINSKCGELLNKKTNEAHHVLPKIFSDAGWFVTVTDTPYVKYSAGFGDFVDEEFLKECPSVRQCFTHGKYTARYLLRELRHNDDENMLENTVRDGIIQLSILQALYPPIRSFAYTACILKSTITDIGFQKSFIDEFSTLFYLPELTAADAESSSYTILHNLTPHDVCLLAGPDYEPSPAKKAVETAQNVRSAYNFQDRVHNTGDLAHYECLAAAFLRIGRWLDSLRELGIYDNTRIIIVGDHGNGVIPIFPGDTTENILRGSFHTLLMVKDFNSEGEFRTDGSFMTNADTAWLSINGLGLDMRNPYTGKVISDGRDTKSRGVNVFRQIAGVNPISYVDSPAFPVDIKQAYHVSDDIYVESNWIPFAEWIQKHPEDAPEGAE